MSESRCCIVRATAALAVAALGVHQGRYLAGFGDHAGTAQAAHGHAYLGAVVTPAVLVVLAIVLAQLLGRTLAPATAPAPPAARLRRLWLRSTLSLLVIYAAQELAEGAIVPAHSGGLEGVLAHGGWVALPLAVVLGAAVALALGAARAVESAPPAARLTLRLSFSWPSAIVPRAQRAPVRPGAVLADHLAGRAPPVLCR